MKNRTKLLLLALLALAALLLGIGVGSVAVPPGAVLRILGGQLLGLPLAQDLNPLWPGLVMAVRLPRVLTAFLAGAALAVSGVVMQSVLQNPLASSYGLGVSSGAGLGAAIVMVCGVSGGVLGSLLLPAAGLALGLATVAAALALASRLDHDLSNTTVILTGMVLSLFVNALLNLLATANPDYTHRILLWQLGSFAGLDWCSIGILALATLLCTLAFTALASQLDLLTFGEEPARAMGLETRRSKWVFITLTAVLTGTAVAFVGVVGFVDLIAPHLVRRFFGSSHRWVLPASALFGGGFMVLCDLAGRTLAAPSEIPVGSITALLGAPFFLYLYTAGRRGAQGRRPRRAAAEGQVKDLAADAAKAPTAAPAKGGDKV